MNFLQMVPVLVSKQIEANTFRDAQWLEKKKNFRRQCIALCYQEIGKITGDLWQPSRFSREITAETLVDLLEILINERIAAHHGCAKDAIGDIRDNIVHYETFGDLVAGKKFAETYGVEALFDDSSETVNALEGIAASCMQGKRHALLAFVHLVLAEGYTLNDIAMLSICRHLEEELKRTVEAAGDTYRGSWDSIDPLTTIGPLSESESGDGEALWKDMSACVHELYAQNHA